MKKNYTPNEAKTIIGKHFQGFSSKLFDKEYDIGFSLIQPRNWFNRNNIKSFKLYYKNKASWSKEYSKPISVESVEKKGKKYINHSLEKLLKVISESSFDEKRKKIESLKEKYDSLKKNKERLDVFYKNTKDLKNIVPYLEVGGTEEYKNIDRVLKIDVDKINIKSKINLNIDFPSPKISNKSDSYYNNVSYNARDNYFNLEVRDIKVSSEEEIEEVKNIYIRLNEIKNKNKNV